MSNQKYSKQECIDALHKAYDILGESPTATQYRELDIYPTYSVFYDIFGSWNEAKNEAGLDTYSTGRQLSKKPTILNLSTEEWENMTPSKRHQLRRKSRINRIKLNSGCVRCGFSKHPSALEFHHTKSGDKEFNITEYIRCNEVWENVKEEIHKCEILCSNCHRIEESNWPSG